MLGKVFKYEMRASARFMLPALGATLGLTLLLYGVRLVSGLMMEQPQGSGMYTAGVIAQTFALIMGTLLFSVAAFVFIGVLAVRFYQAFSGAEAYTTFMLPVKVSTLLWGRVLCGGVYSLCAAACMMFAFPLLFPKGALDEIHYSTVFIQGVQVSGSTQTFALGSLPGWIFALVVVGLFLMMALSVFTGLLQLYAAVALGGQFGSSRIPLTVAAYFILNAVESVISLVIMGAGALLYISSQGGMDALVQRLTQSVVNEAQIGAMALEFGLAAAAVGLFISILFGVLHFLLCRWLYTKKLNLT